MISELHLKNLYVLQLVSNCRLFQLHTVVQRRKPGLWAFETPAAKSSWFQSEMSYQHWASICLYLWAEWEASSRKNTDMKKKVLCFPSLKHHLTETTNIQSMSKKCSTGVMQQSSNTTFSLSTNILKDKGFSSFFLFFFSWFFFFPVFFSFLLFFSCWLLSILFFAELSFFWNYSRVWVSSILACLGCIEWRGIVLSHVQIII